MKLYQAGLGWILGQGFSPRAWLGTGTRQELKEPLDKAQAQVGLWGLSRAGPGAGL